jgi:hypothetical protein
MATTTTATLAVKQVVSDPVVRGVFTYDNDDPASFWKIFGPQETSEGGASNEGTLQTAAFAGVARVEGDAHSAVQELSFSRPILSYASCMFDGTIMATDHLKAALKGDIAAWWPVLAREVMELMKGIVDSFHGRWLGATYDGLRLAVSATGTYWGLDHAAVTGWASASRTVSAALNLPDMDGLRTTLLDNERRKAGGFNKILWPVNQEANYLRMIGPGVRTSVTVNVPNGEQPRVDLGDSREVVRYGGRDCVSLPDLLDTSIFFLNTGDFSIIARESEAGNGGWKVGPSNPDSAHREDTNIAGMFLLKCRDPFRQGVLLSVNA